MTRFDIGDGMQGLIGVVGPTRMDYAQVTARLSYFAENLGRMFSKPELPPSNNNESGIKLNCQFILVTVISRRGVIAFFDRRILGG